MSRPSPLRPKLAGGHRCDRCDGVAFDARNLGQLRRHAVSPTWCLMAISAAFSILGPVQLLRMVHNAANGPLHADPTSPWHPSSAPEIDALRSITVPITPAVNRTPGRRRADERLVGRSAPRLPADEGRAGRFHWRDQRGRGIERSGSP